MTALATLRLAACFPLAVLGLLLALASAPPAAAAKIVGVLYDDSGSMAGRTHLPAFGAQVLASTLDGRPGHDQLLSARLSDFNAELKRSGGMISKLRDRYGEASPAAIEATEKLGVDFVHRESFETPAMHQAFLDTIASGWVRAQGGTPYEPLELILRQLVERTGTDDQAFLIVLTDGAFFDGNRPGPGPAALERAFRSYKQRLKGSLRVEFVLIGPDADTRRRVDEQGVRDGLLSVFNGGAGDGNHQVDTVDDLRRALFDITARIASTDRSGRGDLVRIGGDRIAVSSPFSITRIVSVAAGAADRPVPELAETSFAATPAMTLSSAMRGPDTAEGWRNERLRATTTHFRFHPALPAGPVALRYDRPVEDKVMLLFETGTRLELSVRDARGGVVPPGADGVIELMQGHPYALNATLSEPAGRPDQREIFDFAKLPSSARLTAWTDPGGRRSGLPLTLDVPNNRAHGALPTDATGSYEAGGTFSVPGFVIQEGARLKLRVVSPAVAYDIGVQSAVPCPACGTDEVMAPLHPGVTKDTVGRLTVSQTQGRAAQVTVALRDAPAWLGLVDAAGLPVPPDRPLPLSAGQPITLELRRDLSDAIGLGRRENRITIEVRSLPPYVGEAAKPMTIILEPPDVSLTYAGHSRGPASGPPLSLTGADLEAGDQRLFFEIANAPFPPRAEQIRVDSPGGLLNVGIELNDSRLALRVGSDHCACALWFRHLVGALPDRVTVSYQFIDDLEPVPTTVPIRIEPRAWEALESCLPLILAVLGAVYAALAVRTFFSTHRFPRGSVAQILDRNATLPRYEDLRHWSVRSLGFLLLQRSHARRVVEGLLLEAKPDGAAILLAESDQAFVIERLGQSIGQIRHDQPTLADVLIFWGERLSRPRGPKSLILMREFQA